MGKVQPSRPLPRGGVEVSRPITAEQAACTVVLSYPVEIPGQEPITELHFRRVRLGDLRKVNISNESDLDMGVVLDLTQRLTGQPMRVIEEIDAEDIDAITEAITGFFSRPGSSPDSES